jgi:YbbR domain-containing protein
LAKAELKYSYDKKKPGKAKAFFICLVIAAFLWVVHSLNSVYNYNLKVPVVFKNTPRNKVPLYLKCEEGFGYKRPVISPAFVTIWGDTALIDKIDTMYTQPFTLTNLNKSVNTRLELLRPSMEVYSGVNDVNVNIEVDRLVEQSIVLNLSDVRQNYGKQIQLFPARVKVRFTSIQNAFNLEDTALFRAMIDSDKLNALTKKCPVFLSTVPGNVTVMDIQPKEVEILIFHKK